MSLYRKNSRLSYTRNRPMIFLSLYIYIYMCVCVCVCVYMCVCVCVCVCVLLLLIKKLSKSRVSSWHSVAIWQCIFDRSNYLVVAELSMSLSVSVCRYMLPLPIWNFQPADRILRMYVTNLRLSRTSLKPSNKLISLKRHGELSKFWSENKIGIPTSRSDVCYRILSTDQFFGKAKIFVICE